MIGLSRQEVNQGWARNTLIPREKLSPVPEIAPFLVMGLDRTVVLSRLARKAEKNAEWGKSREEMLSKALASRSRLEDILNGMEHVLGVAWSQNHNEILMMLGDTKREVCCCREWK